MHLPWPPQGAVTVARRVAEERGVEVGTEIGYAVRFEDRSCPSTKVKYLTGGRPGGAGCAAALPLLSNPSLSLLALSTDGAHGGGVPAWLLAQPRPPRRHVPALCMQIFHVHNGDLACVMLVAPQMARCFGSAWRTPS